MAIDNYALDRALGNIKKRGRRKRVERMLPRDQQDAEFSLSIEMPRQEGPGEAEEGMRRSAGQTMPERLGGRQSALSGRQLEGMEGEISRLGPSEEQREEQREEEEEAEDTRRLSPEGEEILRSIDPAIESLRRYRSPLER
jgi:hypothetical protein